MLEIPRARVHRIDGRTLAPSRTWALPGRQLLRLIVGIWPATLTMAATATIVVANAL